MIKRFGIKDGADFARNFCEFPSVFSELWRNSIEENFSPGELYIIEVHRCNLGDSENFLMTPMSLQAGRSMNKKHALIYGARPCASVVFHPIAISIIASLEK